MKKLIEKLISFLEKLLKKFKKQPVETPPTIPNVEVEPEDSLPKPPPVIEQETQEKIDSTGDPKKTKAGAQVQTFLWKPLSDTNPIVSVITVSADDIRSDELFVEILDKSNKVIPNLIPGKNRWSAGRGNGLPGYKYERINFKPGLTDKQFQKHAPIKVKFYTQVGKVKTYVKVMNKDFIKVDKPTQRLDLK